LAKFIFVLSSNQITKLSDSYNLPFRSTLGTFFLGENHLTSIPSDFFRKKSTKISRDFPALFSLVAVKFSAVRLGDSFK
jgi:hypothetical protein